ncbi:ilGF domain-containing protein [Caerostris darwini]|uniref:IlGF domain-containing protein n=1 Tax=Caerostris darwini TaxID=1538125 RepID=A0AAV4PTP7_9ARAC|nr:ilGF domain-containing protein [Caerostris darwini]
MYKIAIFLLACLVCCCSVSLRDQKLCGDELPATVNLFCKGQFDTKAAFTEPKFSQALAERCCSSPCDTETLLSFCDHLAE